MGRKRAWPGQYVYLFVAGVILCLLWGCGSFERTRERIEVRVAAEPAAQERTPETASTGTGKAQSDRTINEIQSVLRRGREYLVRGDFEGALKENQKALSLSGGREPADEALFAIGLVYAHSGNPKKDQGKALGSFRRLAKDYPDSPWAEPAKAWVVMIQENEKLNEMIEKSKQVDIEIEEKRKKIR